MHKQVSDRLLSVFWTILVVSALCHFVIVADGYWYIKVLLIPKKHRAVT